MAINYRRLLATRKNFAGETLSLIMSEHTINKEKEYSAVEAITRSLTDRWRWPRACRCSPWWWSAGQSWRWRSRTTRRSIARACSWCRWREWWRRPSAGRSPRGWLEICANHACSVCPSPAPRSRADSRRRRSTPWASRARWETLGTAAPAPPTTPCYCPSGPFIEDVSPVSGKSGGWDEVGAVHNKRDQLQCNPIRWWSAVLATCLRCSWNLRQFQEEEGMSVIRPWLYTLRIRYVMQAGFCLLIPPNFGSSSLLLQLLLLLLVLQVERRAMLLH